MQQASGHSPRQNSCPSGISPLRECMGIKIRSMTMRDLDQVMSIEPVAFGVHHWSYQSFENEVHNSAGYYFVALGESEQYEGEEIIGYSGFWLIGEEVHITTLAVHPRFRRQYVGERLLINDIFCARRLGARWITLEVRISNQRAQNLYSKYGFKSLGVRKHYYQDNNEDALVLWTENIESPQFLKLLNERQSMIELYLR